MNIFLNILIAFLLGVWLGINILKILVDIDKDRANRESFDQSPAPHYPPPPKKKL